MFVCIDLHFMNHQEDEWLTGFADEPLCTVLSNNHNFHLTGKWYDEKCSESGYGFVCQKPQGKIPSVSLSLARFCHCQSFTASLIVFQHVRLCLLAVRPLQLSDAEWSLMHFSYNLFSLPPRSGILSADRCFLS